jgi:hypothetical protein
MDIFTIITCVETAVTCSVLPYSPLQEMCDKYGNQTGQQGASSFKKTGQICVLYKRI